MREEHCTQGRQVRFRYRMELSFDGKVQDHHYTLKCLPETNLRQTIIHRKTTLLPEGCHWESSDSFGNRELLGVLRDPHERFRVLVEGEALFEEVFADLGSQKEGTWAALFLPEGMMLCPEEAVNPDKLGIYRYPTELTRPGEKIRAYYEKIVQEFRQSTLPVSDCQSDRCMSSAEHAATRECSAAYDGQDVNSAAAFAVFLMHRLHADFTYQKAATDVTTTAEQALERGAGVCQDYAQVFLALVRLFGIPARYVTGMLEGEGQSHAWIEIALGGYWYGLDPTNDCAVAHSHVKIGSGRDFADCRISQGVFRGAAHQELLVEAAVIPVE